MWRAPSGAGCRVTGRILSTIYGGVATLVKEPAARRGGLQNSDSPGARYRSAIAVVDLHAEPGRVGQRDVAGLVEQRHALAAHDLADPLRVPEVVLEADEVGAGRRRGGPRRPCSSPSRCCGSPAGSRSGPRSRRPSCPRGGRRRTAGPGGRCRPRAGRSSRGTGRRTSISPAQIGIGLSSRTRFWASKLRIGTGSSNHFRSSGSSALASRIAVSTSKLMWPSSAISASGPATSRTTARRSNVRRTWSLRIWRFHGSRLTSGAIHSASNLKSRKPSAMTRSASARHCAEVASGSATPLRSR